MPKISLASPSGNLVDADDLDREIVLAALPIGLLDDERSPRASRLPAWSLIAAATKRVADMLIDAVGRQQEDVAFFDLERLVVDFDLRIDAERAAQIALFRRDDDPVIVGELLERVAGDAVDPAIADMKDMRGAST